MKVLVTSILLLSAVVSLVQPSKVFAQLSGYGIAYNVAVSDSNIKGGDIVVLSETGIVRAATPYATKLYGVAVDNPLVVAHDQTNSTRAIASGGEAQVTVSAKNGGIKEGDFITSSEIPGVGQKARNAGYVIGIAKTSFPSNGSAAIGENNEQGTITILINIHYAASAPKDLGNPIIRLIDTYTTALEDQSKVSQNIRYLIGTLLALIVFIGCLLVFARGIKTSIDAMGRNPLAKSTIQMSMIIIFSLTLLLTIIGAVVAFLIIRL